MLGPSHHSPLLGLAAALLLSCSSTQTLESAGACIEGQSTHCTCGDGTPGFRTCGRDSEYGACDCGGQLASGSGGMQSTGGSAGSSIGGSSGAGGAAGTGGSGGSNPIGGSGGSAGVAGAGGSAGSMVGGMTGGSTGIGGESATGGMGGIGGTDPIGGQSGGGEGGDSGPGRDPQPGELYGDCQTDGSCDDMLLCVNNSSGGLTESYCTTTCDALAGMTCPRVRGERMATCLFGICVR